MARSLNKVMLIGNLTRDPELRYTPSGSAVCTFSIATNRSWTTDQGEKKKKQTSIVASPGVSWQNFVVNICPKGARSMWKDDSRPETGQIREGAQKSTTEIVLTDMLLIDSQRGGSGESEDSQAVRPTPKATETKPAKVEENLEDIAEQTAGNEEQVAPDDIPF